MKEWHMIISWNIIKKEVFKTFLLEPKGKGGKKIVLEVI